MKEILKKVWNARFPIRNRFTVGLGLIFLAIAIYLMIVYRTGGSVG